MSINTPLPYIVLGAGGHARVLIDALLLQGVFVESVLDADSAKHGTVIFGVQVRGGDGLLSGRETGSCRLVNGLGSVHQPHLRQSVHERFSSLGYLFATVVHPSAIVSPNAELELGVQVMAGAVVQAGVRIGCGSIINTSSSVDHDCVIGAHCHIAPGAVLSGQVLIGPGSHVGAGAVVIQGVHIGAGCVVGAGAVVLRAVPDGATVAGVPAIRKGGF